jgi:hypothetical protein
MSECGGPRRLAEIARALETLGFNVVPVGADKRPLGRWSASERLWSADDIERLGDRVRGIAITGNYYLNGEYLTAILDIDDPDLAGSVLSRVWPDWRQYLCGGTETFCGLTGPRPKGELKCGRDACINPRTGEAVPLDRVRRGVYAVVRVPRDCAGEVSTARAGAVELLVNNYQVVYGEHPSGLCYSFARWEGGRWIETDRPGPGVILTCKEWRALLSALRGAGRAETLAVPPPGCPEWRPLRDARLLVEALRELWPARRPDGTHYHDEILYALVSVARRNCVDPEQLRAALNELFEWAVRAGHDTPQTVREHWRQTFEYAYGGKEVKLWGAGRLESAILGAAAAMGIDETVAEAIVDDVLHALGVKSYDDEGGRPICLPLVYEDVARDGIMKTRVTAKLCNTGRGIVRVEYRRERGDGHEGRQGAFRRKVSVVVNARIRQMVIYRDAELDIEYADVEIEVPGASVVESRRMIRVDELARVLERRLALRSVSWKPVVDYFPRRVDYIVSGFVCPPDADRFQCGVRDYFNTGIAVETSRAETRDALESLMDVLDKFAPTGAWYETAMAAFFHGAYQNFFFTRKLWGVRPQLLVLVGPRGTGKTTVARLLLQAFFPRAAHALLFGAYTVLSAARIGRLQASCVTTLAIIDEADRVTEKGEVYATLKTYISHPYAWRTATGDAWPARAGLILTANSFVVEDPELSDKIYAIAFNDLPDPSRRTEFALAVGRVSGRLVKFGAFYLRLAAERWAETSSAILAPDATRGAEEYARMVADDLNVSVELARPAPVSAVVMPALERYARLLYSYVLRHVGPIRAEEPASAWFIAEKMIEKGLMPHHKLVASGDGTRLVLITPGIQADAGISLQSLCHELGGELLDSAVDGRHASGCLARLDAILDLLSERASVEQ